MPKSIIDQSVFNALKDSVGADFIVELVNTFLGEAPNMISDMRASLSASDVDTFRLAAHSLKSNASTFGALELADLARELEMLARQHQLRNVGNKVDPLSSEYEKVASALKKLVQ